MFEAVLGDHAIVLLSEYRSVGELCRIRVVASSLLVSRFSQESDESAVAAAIVEQAVRSSDAGSSQAPELLRIEHSQPRVLGERVERVATVVTIERNRIRCVDACARRATPYPKLFVAEGAYVRTHAGALDLAARTAPAHDAGAIAERLSHRARMTAGHRSRAQ